MNVGCVSSAGAVSHDTPLLVLPVHEPEEESEAPKAEVLAPEGLSKVLSGAFPVEDLKHKAGESALVYLNEGGGFEIHDAGADGSFEEALGIGKGNLNGKLFVPTLRQPSHVLRQSFMGESSLISHLAHDTVPGSAE